LPDGCVVSLVQAPWGAVRVVESRRGLRRVELSLVDAPNDGAPDSWHGSARQLEQYFRGELREFTMPLDLEGATEFQRGVLLALKRVPYATLVSYGELARAAGNPRAARAVGAVMRTNPLPIVIPCHRVIATGGAIGGFSCGLEMKRCLLAIEGASLADRGRSRPDQSVRR
jgi:methylated-DNA-[protein]-cysteine S-methyltransferase